MRTMGRIPFVSTACVILLAALPCFGFEKEPVQVDIGQHDYPLLQACSVVYYNSCRWIWSWSGWSAGDVVGACYDTWDEPTCDLLDSGYQYFYTAYPGYGFTGAFEVWDVDDCSCVVGDMIASVEVDPTTGWNFFDFDPDIFLAPTCRTFGVFWRWDAGTYPVVATDGEYHDMLDPVNCPGWVKRSEGHAFYFGKVGGSPGSAFPMCPPMSLQGISGYYDEMLQDVFLVDSTRTELAATTIGGGGLGEPVVKTGVWNFDLLSEEQYEEPTSCENTAFNPFGEILETHGWLASSDSSLCAQDAIIAPRIDFLEPEMSSHDSLEVGGGVMTFYDPLTSGFVPHQRSVMEGPVMDLGALGLDYGPMRFAFSATSNPVPDSLVFLVGSRVFVGSEWSSWADARVPIEAGLSEYRVDLAYAFAAEVESVQTRVGVKNTSNQQVEDKGPAADKAKVAVEENKEAQGDSTWKYVPDIAQDQRPICLATATANCLSYMASQGYPNLVSDDEEPEQRNWKLQEDLVEIIHGPKGQGDFGIETYIKSKGYFKGQPQEPGTLPLNHLRRSKAKATWDSVTTHFSECHDVLLAIQWFYADGQLVNRDVAHRVTLAGVVVDKDGNKKLYVANPWGAEHHTPTKKTRLGAYDEWVVTLLEGDRIRVDHDHLKSGVPGVKGADHVRVQYFNYIYPYEKEEQRSSLVRSDHGRETHGREGTVTYEYTILNEDTTPLNYFALIVDVPYENVQSPSGWTSQALPAYYPGFDGCNEVIGPAGILWTTSTDPIPPGSELLGFTFDADDSYPSEEFGLNWYTETEGLEGTYGIATGPVMPPAGVDRPEDVTDSPLAQFLEVSPNPFSSQVAISYQLDRTGDVRIEIYDIRGRLVQIVRRGRQAPGSHTVMWDASREATGVYFVKLITGGVEATSKVVKIK